MTAKKILRLCFTLCIGLLPMISGCYAPNSPCINCDESDQGLDDDGDQSFTSIRCVHYFPYRGANKWWHYLEAGGNSLTIDVVDTISDENTSYYKVCFAEEQIDTTTDWFKSTSDGIFFSSSLTGTYEFFLPARLTQQQGTFSCGSGEVHYRYHEQHRIDGILFEDVLVLDYETPLLHNFDTIIFAKDMGIVALTDEGGRFPVTYSLDSSSVSSE
ncbi:MAG: hypothetical protein ACOC41_04900 [Chitinivibrionales bacterium]